MKNATIYSDIVSTIKTKEDMDLFRNEVQILLDAVYKENKFEEVLKGSVREQTALLVSSKLSLKTPKEKFLKGLKDVLSNVVELKISLSFAPTHELVERIHTWFLENIKDDIVLDIKVDKKMLAGIRISYKGEYRDYSVSKRVDELTKNIRLMLNEQAVNTSVLAK